MRQSGILMHITSLPGPYGIGTMGKSAYAFVDFLRSSGQTYWQLLPLNPTGYGDSPYQAFSSHAGNPYLIDLQDLIELGLLKSQEVDPISWSREENRVDFGILYSKRLEVLYKAFSRFTPGEDYEAFLEKNARWLPDYGLFMALKQTLGGTWLNWPRELMLHEEKALCDMQKVLADQISFQYFLQYTFFRQWKALHAYASRQGIQIIGDVPIYVPLDSADVWAEPQFFQLDEDRRPTAVAGCPPDGFSADGQLWGNPLYNWQALHDSGYDWWLRRMRSAKNMYDVIRIDHFRGFESYWSIPAGDTHARNGHWCPGPGIAFLQALRTAMPELQCIAEDLGFITPQVRDMQIASGYPGMKLIEFAFDSRESGNYFPHLYPVDSVCYTGTHDNAPLVPWFQELTGQDRQEAICYLGLNREEGYVWGLLRGGMSSVSRIFIAQMQDYLQTGSESRMNCPGTLSSSNWTWRASPGFDSPALSQKIYQMTRRFGRLPE